jgi:uncharacterized protein (DUF302 family)
MIIGILIGIVATVVAMVVFMRSKMIVTGFSRFGFIETVEKIEAAIQNVGWSLVDSKRLNDNLEKHGVAFQPRVHLIKLCKAQYAADVLSDNRQMACLMPCTIAVYETDEGQTVISKMNTGLMGKMFGGSVARVMGGLVAEDEKKMLAPIFDKKKA